MKNIYKRTEFNACTPPSDGGKGGGGVPPIILTDHEPIDPSKKDDQDDQESPGGDGSGKGNSGNQGNSPSQNKGNKGNKDNNDDGNDNGDDDGDDDNDGSKGKNGSEKNGSGSGKKIEMDDSEEATNDKKSKLSADIHDIRDLQQKLQKKIEEEAKMTPTGGMITDDEFSKKLQKAAGIKTPTLPTEKDLSKFPEEARRNLDKLSSHGVGGGPGNMRRAIERLTAPIVNWRAQLKKFIGTALSDVQEYLGNRMYLHRDELIYDERNIYEGMNKAIFCVDTSGSMSPQAIEILLSEIIGVMKAKKVKKGMVVYFDDVLQGYDELGSRKNNVESFRNTTGGGGTSFDPPLYYMEEQFKKHKADVFFMMTDGYADTVMTRTPMNDKLIWVIVDNPSYVPPVGKMVIHISDKQIKEMSK